MKKIILAILAAAAITGSAWGATPPAKPDEKTIADAYIYLLGRALVIRQEHIDRRGDAFAYNAIKYNPLGSADFVNPNGGAIALGHPLGMSGARLALTALHALEKRGGKRALATMCVGVGQGVSLAIERV